jgi:hypothetical protein
MGYAKERTPNGWTLQTLHDHFLELLRASKALEDERFRTQDVARETETAAIRQRFADFDKAINAALAAAEKAVNAALVAQNTAVSKAEEASNKRFDGVNEFRAALTDQSNTMLPRTEADQRFKGMEERLARQERISSERAGSQAQGESSKNMNMWMIGLTVTVVLAVAAIVADIIIRH